MTLFSELQNRKPYVAPENILVIKRAGVDYLQYWSEEKNKFGPLLEATIYNETPTNVVDNGEVADYRKLVGLK